MKISVVMATYNGEKYLTEQLDSIKNQSRTIDEVIICDDGSTDKTVEIAKQYIEKNGLEASWTIIRNEKNLGYADNFDKVTCLANGEYIFFADQDDLWHEDKIQIMTDIMEQKPDCMVLCTDYEPFYDGEKVGAVSAKSKRKMPDNGELQKVSMSAKSIYIGALGCCMCVRRKFYHTIKSYWFDGWAQDDRMWRLSQCANGCYILHSNLVKHRIHGNNTATYGKYHTVEKRLKLFKSMQKANCEMKQMLEATKADTKRIKMMSKHIRMMDMRIDLLENRKFTRCLQLPAYFRYYQELKSYLVELYIALMKK